MTRAFHLDNVAVQLGTGGDPLLEESVAAVVGNKRPGTGVRMHAAQRGKRKPDMMEQSFSTLSLSMPLAPSTLVRRITLLQSRIMLTQSLDTSAWSLLPLLL